MNKEQSKTIQIRNSTADFLVFTKESGRDTIEVRVQDENVWLTQEGIAKLFDKGRTTIVEHLKHIFEEGELEENSVCRDFRQTATDGKSYNMKFFNLEAIISVGYRVNSVRATQFRQWATKVLKLYTVQGYVLDKNRLENGQIFYEAYFDHLVEEIQEIRASERKFYQKITDIYATASDYSVDAVTTKNFFATVQNMRRKQVRSVEHFAVSHQTAADAYVPQGTNVNNFQLRKRSEATYIVYNRADHTKKNMGLTSWKSAPNGKIVKSDAQAAKAATKIISTHANGGLVPTYVSIAKNYLEQEELSELNEIVEMYLDYANRQARHHIPMTMEDWAKKLDVFLQMNDADILHDKGKVTHEIAKAFAESEFEQYRVIQDRTYKSDFDRLLEETKVRGM